MDSINERCPNSMKSNEEIEKLCTPDYNNFIDKCVHLLNTGQAFQKIYVCQNIDKAIDFEILVQDLATLMISKVKSEDQSIGKELLRGLSVLVTKMKFKDHLLQQITQLCHTYFSTSLCDQVCELLQALSKSIDLHQYHLLINEDSVRYEILKVIEICYPTFSPAQQAAAQKHIKQCIGRKNEKMCRIVDQVVLSHEALLLQLIRDQDWLKGLVPLISDFDKQVRVGACRLFLHSFLKMEEQGYEGHLKQADTLQDILPLISDDLKLIIPVTQCLVIVRSEKIQQTFMDSLRPGPMILDYIKDYYQYVLQFDSKIRQQYDDFLINQVSNMCDISKEFSFLKHLAEVYLQLSEQTHQQLIQVFFSNFELNQILYIPYLLHIINTGNRIKNRQFAVQLQRIFDILKKSIFQYEQKGLWSEVDETITILECLAQILNLKSEFYTLCFSYLQMGSQHIRKKISMILVESLAEQYEKVVPQYLQLLQNSNYNYRLLLLDFCIQVCRRRSRNFFKHCNLQQVLQLQNDPVFMVRVKVVQLIYEMRMLFWNEEKDLVVKLQQSLSTLQADKRQNVAQLAKDIGNKLLQIHFHHPETIIKQDNINNMRESLETLHPRSMIRLKTPTKNNSARLTTPNKIQSQTPTLKKQQQVLFSKPIVKYGAVQLPKVPSKEHKVKKNDPVMQGQNSKNNLQKQSKDY